LPILLLKFTKNPKSEITALRYISPAELDLIFSITLPLSYAVGTLGRFSPAL